MPKRAHLGIDHADLSHLMLVGTLTLVSCLSSKGEKMNTFHKGFVPLIT